jgi:uncharacterized protein (DUF427 family)
MATRLSEVFPREELRFEPIDKWVRALRHGETVVSSRRARLVWEPDRVVPTYAFLEHDVRMDLLEEARAPEEDRHGGTASRFWAFADGDGSHPYDAWAYDDPDLEGHVALRWGAMDAWYEEEERVLGHPRDPFKRIDVRQSSRHVRIEVGGEVLAETRLARLLFETGLPVRYYVPPEDVRRDLLRPTASTSFCAYKGQASYYSVEAAGELHEDLAWTYRDPLPDNGQIKDLICFYDEKADVFVDGERQERPKTQWS